MFPIITNGKTYQVHDDPPRNQYVCVAIDEVRHVTYAQLQAVQVPGATRGHTLASFIIQVLEQPQSSDKEKKMIGLDYETYGERSLPVCGLDNYVADPKFRVLIASVAWRDVHGVMVRKTFDFVHDPDALLKLKRTLHGQNIVAHNASFERAVSKRIGLDIPIYWFVDSAAMARCMGVDSHLENAAPQLISGAWKMEQGKRLIRKFSIPQQDGSSIVDDEHAAGTLENSDDWLLFAEYCEMDAQLSLQIWELAETRLLAKELDYEHITQRMNDVGWRVDLDAVKEMRRRYIENQEEALASFQRNWDQDKELNFNSTPQMIAWCKERGIKATSFDESHVDKLWHRLNDKLNTMVGADPKYLEYLQVFEMLTTKRALGGSSLTKLKVLLNTTSEDGILRNQYMHVGAGQTYRTSGRGVQMQNLKRLGADADDMDSLADDDSEWDNEMLARNIRQAFTSRYEDGELIVGDLKSVESRGLAYLAGADWKLDAYRKDLDLYKVQAASIYHIGYGAVTKQQRQTGKVGELSCGYGAGPGAVLAFAAKMGVVMTEEETADLVSKWRKANPEVVDLWANLDELLDQVLATGTAYLLLPKGMRVVARHIPTPLSLTKIHPGAQSIQVELWLADGTCYLQRVFHGCYRRGRQICFYKPSALVRDLWSQYSMDPKTKQRRFHSIYGGKLAGILTQSFCREIFFDCLQAVDTWVGQQPGVDLIGQFHDEIVLDYDPVASAMPISTAKRMLNMLMSETRIPGFPLGADVHSDFRYIK